MDWLVNAAKKNLDEWKDKSREDLLKEGKVNPTVDDRKAEKSVSETLVEPETTVESETPAAETSTEPVEEVPNEESTEETTTEETVVEEKPEEPEKEGPIPRPEIAHVFDQIKDYNMNQGVRTEEPKESKEETPETSEISIEVEEETTTVPPAVSLPQPADASAPVAQLTTSSGALGTVITTQDGPSVGGFSFVINSKVSRGQFVGIQTEEGLLIASVSNVFKTNKYFENAGMVQEYSKGSGLNSAFPVKEWEYTLASCKALGVFTDNGVERVSFPPAPGHEVVPIDTTTLNKFLGLDQERGLDLGIVQQHDLKARFNLTKTVQKHLAILAISGAGKSYTTAVLLEELLSRTADFGRIAIFMIDSHGEYVNLEKEPLFSGQVKVYNAEDIKINIAHMSAKSFAALLPQMSSVQVRELSRIITEIRQKFKDGESYGMEDLSSAIEADESIKAVTKEALKGWLKDLIDMKIFAKADNPDPTTLLEQGKMIIFNFNNLLNLQKKQFIVDYFSRRLFDLRRQNLCPPYLQIIEEAHNFCPEKTKSEFAISRKIIETLAREGRKFYANICLISQRPVQLSTTALSQCNTQIIMKVTNPYDLDHIKRSAEAISSGTLDIISGLRVGEALIIGEAAKYPTFIKVRKRKSQESHGKSLEEYAIDFDSQKGEPVADGKEFI